MIPDRTTTLEEAFNEFVQRPENVDRLFELIDDQIEEKEMVAHPVAVLITGRLSVLIGSFLMTRGIGHLMTSEGGYVLNAHRLIPDIAVIRTERFNMEAVAGYHAAAPDLAVEVISPTDRESKVQRRIAIYLEADVPVWIVRPASRTITVYHPDREPVFYQHTDTLPGTGVMDGFTLPLPDVFVV